MKKKAFACLVGLSLVMPLGLDFATQAPLKDMNRHWAEVYVERLHREGLVVGSQGKFNPNEALKTEDFLVMAIKVVDSSAKALQAEPGETYYKPFMDKALAAGLIQGSYDEVPQYIGRSMPRELAVQVVDRALKLRGETVTADFGLAYKFKDFALINDINQEAVLSAYQLGIIKGSKGYFEPKNPLTRAEAAVLISKLMDPSLRAQLTVFKNPKTYGEVAQWYIEAYEKTMPKRSIVIEKKPGGLINTGDVDFTEKAFYYNGQWHNWWTDQEFEDRILNDISNRSRVEYSASMFGDVKGELEYTAGYYFVHNGELAYILDGGIRDQKAYRHYDDYPSSDNMNRLMYDLSKYGAQYALVAGSYHSTGHFLDTINFIMGGNSRPSGNGDMGFGFYDDPAFMGKFLKCDFPVALRLDMNNENIARYKPLLNQMFIRLYGAKDGPQVFAKIQSLLKGREGGTDWDVSARVNGVHIRASADKYTDIVIWLSLQQ